MVTSRIITELRKLVLGRTGYRCKSVLFLNHSDSMRLAEDFYKLCPLTGALGAPYCTLYSFNEFVSLLKSGELDDTSLYGVPISWFSGDEKTHVHTLSVKRLVGC